MLLCCCCTCCHQEFYTKEGIVVGIYPETKHPTCECNHVCVGKGGRKRGWPTTYQARHGAFSMAPGSCSSQEGPPLVCRVPCVDQLEAYCVTLQ
jgi:hypothetical protein